MEAEDDGRGDAALDNRCRLADAMANEDKREAEELISNLKWTDEAEGEFVRKLAPGRHHGKVVGEGG